MIPPDQAEALFRRLVNAISANDVDTALACLDPSFVLWHNTTQVDEGIDAARASITGLHATCTDVNYAILRVLPTATGVVGTVLLTAVAPDGSAVHMPACMIVDISADGTVTRLDEYLDSAHSVRRQADF